MVLWNMIAPYLAMLDECFPNTQLRPIRFNLLNVLLVQNTDFWQTGFLAQFSSSFLTFIWSHNFTRQLFLDKKLLCVLIVFFFFFNSVFQNSIFSLSFLNYFTHFLKVFHCVLLYCCDKGARYFRLLPFLSIFLLFLFILSQYSRGLLGVLSKKEFPRYSGNTVS